MAAVISGLQNIKCHTVQTVKPGTSRVADLVRLVLNVKPGTSRVADLVRLVLNVNHGTSLVAALCLIHFVFLIGK